MTAQLNHTRPYSIADLTNTNVGFTIPSPVAVFNFNASSFGHQSNLYRETMLGLAIGRTIRNRIALGLNLTYNSLWIKNLGTESSWTLDLGAILRPSDKTLFGLSARNISRAAIRGQPLPMILGIGLAYMPNESVAVEANLSKDLDFSPELRLGAEWSPVEVLALRGGWVIEVTADTQPDESERISAGIGITVHSTTLDYAILMHPTLGATHSFSLHVAIGKEHRRKLNALGSD